MSLDWLQTISGNEVAYLAVLLVGVIALAVIAWKSRDLSTATLVLMAVGIAINVAVGSLINALRLPIYMDSVGTVLVGVLAGPWAGALTGLLANLIWALLPIPGGAGPTIAFFAPVAAVIGLMAGFWAGRGAFEVTTGDRRVGGFLALFVGVLAAAISFYVLQQLLNISLADESAQNTFVLVGIAAILIGIGVAWLSGRTLFAFTDGDPRIKPSLVAAATVGAVLLVFAVLRLLFSPTGWFSSLTGDETSPVPGLDLSGLALSDPLGLVASLVVAVLVGVGAWLWASRGENARLFPVWVGGLTTGLVAAILSAPIATAVFGGVTGAGTDALVALYRSLGLNVLQSAFAQGFTSDPLDKTISFTVVAVILGALPLTFRTMFSRGETTVPE
jgi:energy-coupling factor transport system substrate-specific component